MNAKQPKKERGAFTAHLHTPQDSRIGVVGSPNVYRTHHTADEPPPTLTIKITLVKNATSEDVEAVERALMGIGVYPYYTRETEDVSARRQQHDSQAGGHVPGV